MVKLMSIAGLFGMVIGVGIGACAHSGNGFQTGPFVVLALALSGLGTVATGFLMLVGRRGKLIAAASAFSAAVLVALVVLPLVWPNPSSPGPRPIEGRPAPGQPK